MHFVERHSQLLPICEYVFAPGKSPVLVQPEIFLLRTLYIVFMDWRTGFSSCGERDMDLLGFISFYPPSLYSFYCCFCEAMAGSLSVANTAVSSANVAVIDSVEFGRSEVCNRCNSGPTTLP
jgi:hypothetical protein